MRQLKMELSLDHAILIIPYDNLTAWLQMTFTTIHTPNQGLTRRGNRDEVITICHLMSVSSFHPYLSCIQQQS